MSEYWAKRQAEIQEALTAKSIAETEAQISKYYLQSMKRVIDAFEATYNKLLVSLGSDRAPTPADLYNLDKYWELQSQLRDELTRLGNKQAAILSKKFERQYGEIYNSINLTIGKKSAKAFNKLDKQVVNQAINEIWCADGKPWSQRVWTNTEKLQETLNKHLITCITTGKKPSELKKILERDFGVAYNRADTLVRTEMAHIQTQAAKQRYEDYGLRYYEFLGNDDDTCGNHSVDCHELDGERFLFSEMTIGVNAPPIHPNCKCCIIPVVEE